MCDYGQQILGMFGLWQWSNGMLACSRSEENDIDQLEHLHGEENPDRYPPQPCPPVPRCPPGGTTSAPFRQ
ncbi:unnamed protein product [Larinioides sclopetarius]|uniref:Uncharacterized protein n=1 Tax=Larinioides sclopetarius TaxID=280406 RepID=A0AAV2AKM6_9ARAC